MAVTRRTFSRRRPSPPLQRLEDTPWLAQTQNPTAAAPGPTGSRQAPGFYRFRIGDLEVTAINDGFAPRPLEGLVRNAEFAEVTAAAREAFLPEDAFQNTFTTLVVRHGDRLTLIDTGLGEFGPPTAGTWMANFRAAGFDPAQVDTVIISHFHGDHINGLRRKDGSAVFANAEVMVPAAEWAYWMDDARMGQAPEAMRAGFQGARRVFAPIAKDVKRYEAGKEIVSGITAVAAHGHTPGHSAYCDLVRPGDADGHIRHHEPPGPVRAQSRLGARVRHGCRPGPPDPPPDPRHGGRRTDPRVVLPCALPGDRLHRQGGGPVPLRSGAMVGRRLKPIRRGRVGPPLTRPSR